MGASESADRTRLLLERVQAGDGDASAELFTLLYGELHGIAQKMMAEERVGHTLQPTALVHEAWARLVGTGEVTAEDRAHFVRLASRAMRRVLVDHARRRTAQKRSRQKAVPLVEDALVHWGRSPDDLLALDEALERLTEHDEELGRIVELRFFGGLTLEEAGAVLGMSVRQVHRRWTMARGWLRRELERGGAHGG